MFKMRIFFTYKNLRPKIEGQIVTNVDFVVCGYLGGLNLHDAFVQDLSIKSITVLLLILIVTKWLFKRLFFKQYQNFTNNSGFPG